MGREILCCVPSYLRRETERLHHTLSWHKVARRIPINYGVEHPSGDPSVLKDPILMVGLVMGRRVASSWVLAFLPSCVRVFCMCLTDVGVSDILAPICVFGDHVCVLVFLWSLHVQACLGLPSNCLSTRCVCGMDVSKLRISSLITRDVCECAFASPHMGQLGFESLGSSW